jgi:hypothetical protein
LLLAKVIAADYADRTERIWLKEYGKDFCGAVLVPIIALRANGQPLSG